MNDFPLLVEFVSGTSLYREPETIPKLPIVQNGPPGTFVVFSGGRKVPLPTDQIVFADDSGGSARVGFGGMSFEGMEEGHLVFYRVRGRKMTLEPHMVSSICVDGRHVWPSSQ